MSFAVASRTGAAFPSLPNWTTASAKAFASGWVLASCALIVWRRLASDAWAAGTATATAATDAARMLVFLVITARLPGWPAGDTALFGQIKFPTNGIRFFSPQKRP